jgi:hypothetical protein
MIETPTRGLTITNQIEYASTDVLAIDAYSSYEEVPLDL